MCDELHKPNTHFGTKLHKNRSKVSTSRRRSALILVFSGLAKVKVPCTRSCLQRVPGAQVEVDRCLLSLPVTSPATTREFSVCSGYWFRLIPSWSSILRKWLEFRRVEEKLIGKQARCESQLASWAESNLRNWNKVFFKQISNGLWYKLITQSTSKIFI